MGRGLSLCKLSEWDLLLFTGEVSLPDFTAPSLTPSFGTELTHHSRASSSVGPSLMSQSTNSLLQLKQDPSHQLWGRTIWNLPIRGRLTCGPISHDDCAAGATRLSWRVGQHLPWSRPCSTR